MTDEGDEEVDSGEEVDSDKEVDSDEEVDELEPVWRTWRSEFEPVLPVRSLPRCFELVTE